MKVKRWCERGKPATGMIGNGGLLGSNADILMHQEKRAHALLFSVLSGTGAAKEGRSWV